MGLHDFQAMLSQWAWLRVDFVGPIGIVIAALVSVHVLLTKRDVGTSIGWIGLAWLSPMIGGGIYFLLGINRVKRRARRLTRPVAGGAHAHRPAGGRDDHLAPLEAAAHHLSAGARRKTTTRSARAAQRRPGLPAHAGAIRDAKVSVALASYILHDDAGGGPFIDELIAAHERGVAVRVLLDGVGSGYFRSPAYRRLRRHGVPAARFLHSTLPWRMPFLNLRNHKKILLIDGQLRLHRRDEHRRGEPAGDPPEAPGARHPFPRATAPSPVRSRRPSPPTGRSPPARTWTARHGSPASGPPARPAPGW